MICLWHIPARIEAPNNLFDQVKDWGGGDPDDLDNLEIDSFSGNASSPGKPFYEQMAKQLELLQVRWLVNHWNEAHFWSTCHNLAVLRQAQGALRIAQDNLPEFKNWSFKEGRYLEYLEDQRHIHCIIEESIATMIANPPCGNRLGTLNLSHMAIGKSSQTRIQEKQPPDFA